MRGKRRRGQETVLVVALRSNPEKPTAVRIVQAIGAPLLAHGQV
jgi:hypothetical protein